MDFPASYQESKKIFESMLCDLKHARWSYPCPEEGPAGDSLTVDVARLGPPKATSLLVLSTGLHGVEGPVGMPMLQIAHQQLLQRPSNSIGLLMIHALNPFGFAWSRRQDQEGIDLNRNFLLKGEKYQGSARVYQKMDSWLNPPSPPCRDAFTIRTVGQVLRHGFRATKQAIVEGQYDFPRGLFYGGSQNSWVMKLLASNWQGWVGDAKQILHLDAHSGLGPWGQLQLLGDSPQTSIDHRKLLHCFPKHAKDFSLEAPVHYHARGGLGRWCGQQLPTKDYRYFCAEFGTYGPLKTLAALRQEQRLWEWGQHERRCPSRYREALREIFCPQSPRWRKAVVDQSIEVIDGSLKYLGEEESGEDGPTVL